MTKKYDFEQFTAVRNQTDLTFSPDGQWVAYAANTSGQFNIWKQPVQANGHPAMPIQLTALTENTTRRAIWSPDGSRILTMADRHGTENHQLYEIPAEEGWLYPLTNRPESRFELGGSPFSPDGSMIAYASNERDPASMDVVVMELETREKRPLLSEGGWHNPGDWSPDGQQLLAVRFYGNTNQDILLVDAATGDYRNLTAHEGEIQFSPGSWKADGSGFYLTTDYEREFSGLAFYDLSQEKWEWVETPEWDIQDLAVHQSGRYRAWLVNEDGYSRLYVRDNETEAVQQFANLPAGVYQTMRFSPVEPVLGLYISRAVGPGELFMLNVATGEHWQLTSNFLGGIPQSSMVEPELIRYPTHDGREIPAFLYQPQGLAKGQRVPVVLSIHGGPEAQELPNYAYNGLYQYWLNRGIGVIATNVRGSTGYGKSYQKLIHRDWGGAELKDFEYAVKYLHTLDWVAPDRIGVFGGSFGGFASLSCAARLSAYFAAAVDLVGPSNLVSFTRSVPPHWRPLMKAWVGDPEEDYDLLMERSPITYTDNIEAPILIIQGANDPRVVQAESDQIVARLRELGRVVEYLLIEDEGHGSTKTTNRQKMLRASAEWLEKHLL